MSKKLRNKPEPPVRKSAAHSGTPDPIEPVRIEHGCDDLWLGEQLENRYNFFDYFFEEKGLGIRARAYLDDIATVVVFPALLLNSDQGVAAQVDAPEFRAKTIVYLRGRYRRIEPDDLSPRELRREGG